MTPEKDLSQIVTGVWPESGHWPYTRDSGMYIGYRPGQESMTCGADRIVRVTSRYDLVIFAQRSPTTATDMEELKYKLYAALLAGGWKFDTEPGPETYDERTGLFMWPIQVSKGFAIGKDGLPEDPRLLKRTDQPKAD